MSDFIECQRSLFNIPEDIAYLNTAYISPLSSRVLSAIVHGSNLKAQPWKISPKEHFFEHLETVKSKFAKLFNVNSGNVALIPSASYGISTAAKNIHIVPGMKIIVLRDQFPSNVYPWFDLVKKKGGEIKFVEDEKNCDITSTLVKAIDDKVAVVAVPNVRWTDGALINLYKIKEACKVFQAKLILDLTQSAGALLTDLSMINPDFAIIANYKWMLGPYSTGFMYVNDAFLDGVPLEQTWSGRRGSEDFSSLTDYQFEYQTGANRFDMGERANFSLLPGIEASLDQLSEWGISNIQHTLQKNSNMLFEKLEELGLSTLNEVKRSPHFVSVRLPGANGQEILSKLANQKIYISERSGYLRITPHLWNNNDDFSRLLETLKRVI